MKARITGIALLLSLVWTCQQETKVPNWEEILAQSLLQPSDINYENAFPSLDTRLDTAFNENYFRPWKISSDSLFAYLSQVPGPDSSTLGKYLKDPEYYGENKHRHSDKRRNLLKENIDFSGFPNLMQRGITVGHTNIRRLPIMQPGYDRYTKAGEGFPFDYFQETSLWANTPVLILHTTLDKSWSYVYTAAYKGWIPTNEIAVVDEAFIREWQRGQYISILTDNSSITTSTGSFLFSAKLGMLFPLLTGGVQTTGNYKIYAAVSDEDGQAALKICFLSDEKALPKPLALSGAYLKQLVEELHGNPYGWGGNLENRDCSSTIKDLLAPFGVWVPRNSSDQSTYGKYTADLTGTREEKMALIKERGVPFLTILYKPGHAMLYVGLNEQQEPLIFHTVWGLKSYYKDQMLTTTLEKYPLEGVHYNDKKGSYEGRKIIGRTAITTLTIGQEDPAIKNLIVDELTRMTVLVN